jgi:Kef-type K+ transport system membrane component KefB/Trk K+ transport system NAD-binding subunit
MESIFLEIGIIIIVAGLLAILAKALRQPRILAYIFTGIILGPLVLGIIKSAETMHNLATLGVTFLLFLVGLELDLRKLKEVGRVSVVIGLGQMIFTTGIGFVLILAFGFTSLQAIYISLAIAFSSTVIAVKLLSEKNELDSLYGRITVGFLLVQDLLAVLVLIFLAGFHKNAGTFLTVDSLGLAILKGTGLLVFIILVSKYILSHLFKFVARSSELLFLTSIGWCFIIVIIAGTANLSIEVGAFLAGVSLASLPYNLEIISRVRSLRDFFIILFFVTLGMQMLFNFPSVSVIILILLSLFILVGNPLIVIILMGIMGYKKRTSFLSGITIAQISEFSFIIAAFGYKIGHLSQEIVSLIILIGAITISCSSYMITYADQIYKLLTPFLTIFEIKRGAKKDEKIYLPQKLKNHVIVVGYHRIGRTVIQSLKKLGSNLLVVDFDPRKIKQLEKEKIPHIYGDITDSDILDMVGLSKASMVVSTVPKREDDLFIIQKSKEAKKNIIVFATADQVEEALDLYNQGADYVILPHILGGQHAALLIERMNGSLSEVIAARDHHIHELKKRRAEFAY